METQSVKEMQPELDGSALLDTLLDVLDLKNDAALARFAKIAPPHLSKVRHGRLAVTATLLVRLHDVTGFSINELRAFAASE